MDSGELLYRFGWESTVIAGCPHYFASRCPVWRYFRAGSCDFVDRS